MSTLRTNAIQTTGGKPILNSTGSIIQIAQTVKQDTWTSSSNGTSFYDVTGLSCSITPTSSTNKILVILDVNCSSGYWEIQGRLTRNGAAITGALGTQRGLRSQCSFSVNEYPGGAYGYGKYRPCVHYLDSPATTSAVTYGVQLNGYSSYSLGVNIDVAGDNNDGDYYGCPMSVITLMEVTA